MVEQAKDVNSDLRKQLDKGYLMVYPPKPETKPTVSDEDYYLPRIYFFVPWLTYPEMEPKCKCKRKYSKKGWSSNPIARRVVDRNSCYYIVSYKYFCDSCKTSIYATQPTFLAQLDEFIQESFPAVYTHCGVIDKS